MSKTSDTLASTDFFRGSSFINIKIRFQIVPFQCDY